MTETDAPAQMPFTCPHCKAVALAVVRGVAEWSGWTDAEEQESPALQWTFLQCGHCQHPSVHLREDFGQGFDADGRPSVVYPAPTRTLPVDVPAELRRELAEARLCFDVHAYSACAVMVRRTLEGTAVDQGVNERTLAKALRKLADEDRIDPMLAEWSDALRVVGNKGAHFSKNPASRADAQDALDFAEAFLDHLYVLRRRFDEFRTRLAAPANP